MKNYQLLEKIKGSPWHGAWEMIVDKTLKRVRDQVGDNVGHQVWRKMWRRAGLAVLMQIKEKRDE